MHEHAYDRPAVVVLHLYLLTTGCDRLEPLCKLGCNVQAMAPKTFPVADRGRMGHLFPCRGEGGSVHGSTMFSHPLSSYMLVMINCSLAKNMQAKHFVIVPGGRRAEPGGARGERDVRRGVAQQS